MDLRDQIKNVETHINPNDGKLFLRDDRLHMGFNRKLMRVSLDFKWPMDVPWVGYLNPYHQPCPFCKKEHNGYSPKGYDLSWELGREELHRRIESGELTEALMFCFYCKGEGQDPRLEEQKEAWQPEPPPTGPGYQLWETVSEGSPLSPVFESLPQLVDWLVNNGTYLTSNTTVEQWFHFFGQEMDAAAAP